MRTLRIIGILLLIIGVAGFVYNALRAAPRQTLAMAVDPPEALTRSGISRNAGTEEVAPETLSTQSRTILVEYPPRMELDSSEFISLKLAQQEIAAILEERERPERTVIAGQPIVVGTPEADLALAFGPAYEGYATAQLFSTAFDAAPLHGEETLVQPQITWSWIVTPRSEGRHQLFLRLHGEWQPTDGGGIIEQDLWEQEIQIEVYEPLLTRGQIEVTSLSFSLLGGLFSLVMPWVVRQFGNRQR